MKVKRNSVEVKPYSIGELAKLYNMSIRTIKNWLEPHMEQVGKKIGRYYTVKQVLVIFEILEVPSNLEE